MLHNQGFLKRLHTVILNEGHCLSQWGFFRPEYRDIEVLHIILPTSVKFVVVSAMLTSHMKSDIMQSLWFKPNAMKLIQRSNI